MGVQIGARKRVPCEQRFAVVHRPRFVNRERIGLIARGRLDDDREGAIEIEEVFLAVGEECPWLIDPLIERELIQAALVDRPAEILPGRRREPEYRGEQVVIPGDDRDRVIVSRQQHPAVQVLGLRQADQGLGPLLRGALGPAKRPRSKA